MGAYLTHPKTDKTSTDEESNILVTGASSMQGWRNSQEDAHNSILTYDENTAFFAVYDGHGGAEVATYCADKLPQYLKKLESYQKGNYEQALKDAFLGFDKTLLEPEVIAIMKVLAGDRRYVDPEDSDDEEDEEDLAELQVESNLPLSEVLEKYQGHPSIKAMLKQKDILRSDKSSSSTSRGRRAAAIAADAANKAVMDPDSKPEGSSTSAAALAASESPSSSKTVPRLDNNEEPEEDATVSSSSSGESKINNGNLESGNSPCQTSAKIENNGSISTSVDINAETHSEQNGSVTSSESTTGKADITTSLPQSDAEIIIQKKNKPSTSDSTVSGSNDVTEIKQNGTVDSCSPSGTANVLAADISSTSHECIKLLKELDNAAEDSADDDVDFDGENSLVRDIDCPMDDTSSDENPEENDSDVDENEQQGQENKGDDIDDDDDEEEEEEGADDDEEDDEEQSNDDDECSYSEDIAAYANMLEEPGRDSGCTAVVSLLHGRDLYVANAGDSRCVVCRNGVAIDMSFDHKPEDPEETKRIRKAGGRVTGDGRVNGGLNLSRAIGDHSYKLNSDLPAEEQMISALPDIRKLVINPEDEFMILACDGIWNYMTSAEVVDFVRERIANKTKKLSQICEELFDHCLAPNTAGDGTGCDNMTAVIVKFQPEILNLETKINPDETEDIQQSKQNSASSSEEEIAKQLKRSAEDILEIENACDHQTKRAKVTDDNGIIESTECDSGTNVEEHSNSGESTQISTVSSA